MNDRFWVGRLGDPPIRPSQGVPDAIRRAITGERTDKDRHELKRPRVILSTPLTSEDPLFGARRLRRS